MERMSEKVSCIRKAARIVYGDAVKIPSRSGPVDH